MPDMTIPLIAVSLIGAVAIGAWVRFFIRHFNRICGAVETLEDSRQYIWDRIDDVRKDIKQLQDAIDHINDFLEKSTAGGNIKPRK
jgi:hypothetical protein